MSQRRKKHMARPGLEPRSSPLPCEHSSLTIDPWQFSPWLNGYVPESARNRAGTNETRLTLCCSQSGHGPTLSHQMSWGGGGCTRPDRGFEPRTSHIPCEHSLHFIHPDEILLYHSRCFSNCPRTSRHTDLFNKESLHLQPKLHKAQRLPRPQTFNNRFFKILWFYGKYGFR